MQPADRLEMCSLNHFNSGHFMKVLGKAQVSGIRCLDQHASAGPGHSWLVGTSRVPWDGNVSMNCTRGGEAADGAVPRDPIINAGNDSGAPCVLPRRSTCMHNARLGCGSGSSGTGVRTHLQCQAGRSTLGFGCWETQSHRMKTELFREETKAKM